MATRVCPSCKVKPLHVFSSGRTSGYCLECSRQKTRDYQRIKYGRKVTPNTSGKIGRPLGATNGYKDRKKLPMGLEGLPVGGKTEAEIEDEFFRLMGEQRAVVDDNATTVVDPKALAALPDESATRLVLNSLELSRQNLLDIVRILKPLPDAALVIDTAAQTGYQTHIRSHNEIDLIKRAKPPVTGKFRKDMIDRSVKFNI